MLLASSARRHAADELGAICKALLGMKGTLFASEALTNDFGLLIDEDAHEEGSGL
jgi:hypothetical protein